jgi:hypothetical protein
MIKPEFGVGMALGVNTGAFNIYVGDVRNGDVFNTLENGKLGLIGTFTLLILLSRILLLDVWCIILFILKDIPCNGVVGIVNLAMLLYLVLLFVSFPKITSADECGLLLLVLQLRLSNNVNVELLLMLELTTPLT